MLEQAPHALFPISLHLFPSAQRDDARSRTRAAQSLPTDATTTLIVDVLECKDGEHARLIIAKRKSGSEGGAAAANTTTPERGIPS
ncbi:hypothetical protein OsJ_20874 [Oryza sativa Japonica Group]|uniref:Uncharacterized protein n=1 Tax=Oryza sativa subsp. japonica TaxID=39947 RepID=B9FSL6_ORYSJ|nr:hypothetical protein OsJ_20874 [Oryza sativa Japonica Group]